MVHGRSGWKRRHGSRHRQASPPLASTSPSASLRSPINRTLSRPPGDPQAESPRREWVIAPDRRGRGPGRPNRGQADRQCVWSEIVCSRQECRFLGKSRLGESQFVPWVGATSALCAPPDSCLGEFHPSAQRLHPSAQRRLTRMGRGRQPKRVRAVAEVSEVCHP